MAVRIILGRDSAKLKASEFVEEVANDLLEKLKSSVKKEGVIPYKAFQTELTKRVKNALDKGMDFAIKNMVGSRSGRGTTDRTFTAAAMANFGPRTQAIEPVRGQVRWKSLDYATQKKKGNSEYFIDTGELKKFLTANRKRIVNRTGVIAVDKPVIMDRYGKVAPRRRDKATGRYLPDVIELATLTIRIYPNIPAAFLPGMAAKDISVVDKNQRFESSVIQNLGIENKLLGPSNEKQRALLQPVFSFWANHYIPFEIGRALRGLR